MLPAMVGSLDDRELMMRYRDGDAGAFEQLYARHKGPLYRYFLRQTAGPEFALELFQEVWTKLIQARERYVPSARFNTYLYQLAHRCLIDHWRRQAKAPVTGSAVVDELTDSGDGPDQLAARRQQLERVSRALDQLPAEQREAFLLREEGGLSLAEIAEATGVNPESAKSRLRYAVVKLRRSLDPGDLET